MSTRRAYGRTAASPKTGAGSLGMPKRTRTGFVARLCARRPGKSSWVRVGQHSFQFPHRPQQWIRRQRSLPGKHRPAKRAAAGRKGRAEPHPEPAREKNTAATGARGARHSRAERQKSSVIYLFFICYLKMPKSRKSSYINVPRSFWLQKPLLFICYQMKSLYFCVFHLLFTCFCLLSQ